MFAKTYNRFLLLLITLLFALVVATNATAFESETLITATSESEWFHYIDPRFDFSIEYPADWVLRPREDRPEALGERLVLSKPSIENSDTSIQAINIEIGLYLVERNPSQDIAQWSTVYDEHHDEFAPGKVFILDTDTRSRTDREVFYKEAVSPLTPYTYINVPHGRVVWFIWMNSTDDQDNEILGEIANSISFGKHSPRTLKQAYGNNFTPQPLVPLNNENFNSIWNSQFLPVSANLSNYRVPVNVSANIKCGDRNAETCNGTHSPAVHTGASHAIDISVSYKNVYAAASSTYYSAQQSNTGYGNVVKLRDTQSGYIAYYAHLNWYIVDPSAPLPQGSFIGVSGQSGSPGNLHLHFHVQTTSGSPVYLSGVAGLTLTINYPNCNTNCNGIKALPGKECVCGYAN